ncbi:extensin-1 isoform X3 [Diospyros lotus]|uniref:extensin-1 isoform X1 n=1 Tax=Diospyros lotus TaxID=55363 RepID=UPI00225A9FA0|nr:extensin-1 isoform X1 [Diospyros lotus]XP_052204582.1 extensin-1 isoform X2 [Diospyros lotus]XP_052204583.1 extensin-1 isoform X3 [Diospyros lotus]
MPPKLRLLAPFLSIILIFPAPATQQECPYPCYPPPTGTGSIPQTPPGPATTTPSQPTGSYPPPAFYQSPPEGNLPYSPPDVSNTPPATDPVVSWFPYYYRKPPHQSDQSSSTALRRSTAGIASAHFLALLLLSLL